MLATSGANIIQAYNDGHQIASHSYNHPHLPELDKAGILKELTDTENALQTLIGKKPRYFRPPYGETNALVLQTLAEKGYKSIIWNIDTNDWQYWQTNPSLISKAVTDALATSNPVTDAYISLQHDLYLPSIQQVDGIITSAINEGYKLTTVRDCMNDKESAYQ